MTGTLLCIPGQNHGHVRRSPGLASETCYRQVKRIGSDEALVSVLYYVTVTMVHYGLIVLPVLEIPLNSQVFSDVGLFILNLYLHYIIIRVQDVINKVNSTSSKLSV